MLTERIIVQEEDFGYIEELLTEADIEYDWDSGYRLMVREEDLEEVTQLLDYNDVNYDVV